MILKANPKESHSSLYLTEVSRQDLLSKSRRDSKERYKKRLNYQVSNFRGVDLQQLFENDYFIFTTPINNYAVTIAYPGVLTELREVVRVTYGDPRRINLQMVIKALRRSFDKTNDIKVNCTCGDWVYRFAYWATKKGYKYGDPEIRPSKITNPNDALGATCKHLDLFLSNKRWLTKAASTVNSLIKAYPDKAAHYLYDEEDIKDDEENNDEKDFDDAQEEFEKQNSHNFPDNSQEPSTDSGEDTLTQEDTEQ